MEGYLCNRLISRTEFFEYFQGAQEAFAVEIGRVYKLMKPLDVRLIDPNFIAPQSFRYIESSISPNKTH